MKVKIYFLVFLLLCNVLNFLNGQDNKDNIELGLYFDINGNIINNYCDFDYKIDEALHVTFETNDKFVPGSYYDLVGNKVNGEIKQSNNNTSVYFRTIGQDDILLNPDKYSAYLVGLDSFIVIKNFKVDKTLWESTLSKRDWAQVITKSKNYTLLKNTRKNLIGNDFETTYIMKNDSTSQLIGIFDEKSALSVFGDFPSMKNDIIKRKINYTKVPTLAKMYDYKDKFEKNKKIYFSKSWDELGDSINAYYYAKITDIKGLEFELKFFNNSNTPLYSGHFTSFLPTIKHGEFIWYYSDGSIRKKINYKENRSVGIATEYLKNGQVHYQYNVKNNEFSSVRNREGKELLDSNGNGEEIIFDSVNNRKISRWYISHELLYSLYKDTSQNTIFQYCDNNTSIRSIRNFQNKLDKSVKFSKEAFKNFQHGIVLLKFLVDSTGNTISFNIVRGLGEQFDSQLIGFLKSEASNINWKIPKHKDKPRCQEIIVPFLFEIQEIERINRYIQNNFMWQHQMSSPINNQKILITPR